MRSSDLPRLSSGWLGFFAGLMLLLIVATTAFFVVTLAAPDAVGRWLGVPVFRGHVTPLGVVVGLCQLIFAVGCVGLMRESERGAQVTIYGAYGVAVAQGWEALAKLPTGTFSVPLLAIAYLVYAAAMQRRLAQRRALQAKHAAPAGVVSPVPDA